MHNTHLLFEDVVDKLQSCGRLGSSGRLVNFYDALFIPGKGGKSFGASLSQKSHEKVEKKIKFVKYKLEQSW